MLIGFVSGVDAGKRLPTAGEMIRLHQAVKPITS